MRAVAEQAAMTIIVKGRLKYQRLLALLLNLLVVTSKLRHNFFSCIGAEANTG